MVLWGGWLIVTGLVFSLAQGIIHPYYTVALAPAIGAIVGIGAWFVWSRRSALWARLVLGSVVVVSSVWAALLLDRVPAWHPWLRTAILAAGCAAGVLLVLLPYRDRIFPAKRFQVGARAAVAGLASMAVLAGPFAYTVATVGTPHSGAIPTAGPSSTALAGFPGGGGFGPGRAIGRAGGRGGGGGTFPGAGAAGFGPGQSSTGAGSHTGQFFPGGGPPFGGSSQNGAAGRTGFAPSGTNPQPGGGGGLGGLLNSSSADSAITAALKADASKYTWAAAAVGSNEAAGYQLAAREPVMAIGGFNGTDPAPTLAEFEQYVQEKKIHYFIASGSGFGGFGGRSGSGSDDASLITSWVEGHFSATTVGGVTIYNLTAGEK